MINKVILVGNIGQDPVTKVVNNNNQVTQLSIATTKNWKDANTGERKQDTQWHNLVLWNGLSKIADQYLKKGAKIYVEGELTHRKYEDKNQITRTITEVVVKELKMLGDVQHSNTPPAPAASQPSIAPNTNFEEEDDDLPF